MLIEEDVKSVEINPDALEEGLGDEVFILEEEEVVVFSGEEDEQEDEVDIPFDANDEGYW
jgi:hypothetical protein